MVNWTLDLTINPSSVSSLIRLKLVWSFWSCTILSSVQSDPRWTFQYFYFLYFSNSFTEFTSKLHQECFKKKLIIYCKLYWFNWNMPNVFRAVHWFCILFFISSIFLFIVFKYSVSFKSELLCFHNSFPCLNSSNFKLNTTIEWSDLSSVLIFVMHGSKVGVIRKKSNLPCWPCKLFVRSHVYSNTITIFVHDYHELYIQNP